MLLIRCLLPLWDSVIVLYFATLCPFFFCNHLDGEERERAGCFALFVFLVSRDCCVALPRVAMGWSPVFDCDISNHTQLLILSVIHANSDGFGESVNLSLA